MSDDYDARAIAWMLILAGISIVVIGCAYLKSGCRVVDLTQDVCNTFILEKPDGTKLEVHMDRIQAQAFVRTGAVPADGGCR